MRKCVWRNMGRNGGYVEEDITGDTTGEAFLEEGASWKRRCSSEGTVAQGRPMPGQEQMSVHDRYFFLKK